MVLTNPQIRFLKALAHNKKPIVTVGGKGVSETVLEEVKNALDYHELIKVKLPAIDKADRQVMAKDISSRSDAIIVSQVGRVVVLFHPTNKNKIALPK